MHHDSMDHPESDPDAKKVVCYFTSWAYYRRGEGKFTPADIEADLCTHIVYAYASLDPDEGTSIISQASLINSFVQKTLRIAFLLT